MADVLEEKGEEDPGHDDGGGGGFVFEFAETLVGEHEVGVRVELFRLVAPSVMLNGEETYMNKRSGEDDSRSELLDHRRDNAVDLGRRQFDQERGQEHADGAGDEHDEQGPDAQGHIVVAGSETTGFLATSTF